MNRIDKYGITQTAFDNQTAQIEQAPKRVSFTIIPIGDKAALMELQAKNRILEIEYNRVKSEKYFVARQKAIAMFLEADKQEVAPTASEQIEYDYRKTRLAHLKMVDTRIYGKNNQVICKACNEISFTNYALGKAFFYCRTCKVEV